MRFGVFEISPVGSNVAMEARTDKGVGVWIRDLQRGATSPLGTDGDNSIAPVWSPDGLQVLRYLRPRGGTRTLRIVPVDGGGAGTDIPSVGTSSFSTGWSPDGKKLLVTSFGERTAQDV